MRSDVEHVVVVVRDGDWYRAECSCGWVSEWFNGDDEAEWAAEDHREVVGPGAAFDGFMCDLLDLQDEIAQAVTWLAENWSAYMPVPRWSGGGTDGAELVVRVYCDSLDQLGQVADVLGRPAVDDERVNSVDGNRYRCARRWFGRVRIVAYATLPAKGGEVAA